MKYSELEKVFSKQIKLLENLEEIAALIAKELKIEQDCHVINRITRIIDKNLNQNIFVRV